MTTNGGRDNEFRQASHVKNEYERDVNVGVGNGPSSRRYDELQISKADGLVKGGGDLSVVQRNAPQSQQQPQGSSLVHWEKFLHVRSIKVMLVENDDSTRHIVTALLRNCNYEVIEAANGFQAWKILEDLSNHIDIVLTEVVMPSFSGIGLLCKIMSHKTRKNVPVIMMSSHDSMGLVFKCLSKGASDFLLKPIRKNELKNLWQHVWRRCQSSSGSGSESGTNAQKSVNSKRSDDSISIIGNDIGSSRDGSDDGSGTQNSWTKQAVELESPQESSPSDEKTEHPDSTCGLVIHSQPNKGDIGKGKELEIEGSKDSEMQIAVKNINGDDDIGGQIETLKDSKNIVETNTKVMEGSREMITENSLKRPREVKEAENGNNVLRHSELSAFTRYNTTSNALRTGFTCSSSKVENKSENTKKESTHGTHSDGYLIYQGSNEPPPPGKSGETPPSDSAEPPRVHHIHHHHHVHHYHNVEPKKPPPPPDQEDSGLKELAANCGSSNVFGGGVEVNIENNSLNRSGSGSKHGSNGQNGSSNVENLEGKNVESGGDELAGKSGSGVGGGGGGSGSGSDNRIDQNKSAQREAALKKFREKRKDRCFQKKVRYQNRKRLADHRPRVRGQFVKQTGREGSSNAEDS